MKEQPEPKPMHVYRFDPPHWVAGLLDGDGRFSPVSTHDTPEAAAIAATRLNGNEPEVDGGVGTV